MLTGDRCDRRTLWSEGSDHDQIVAHLAEAMGVVRLRLSRGHSAREPRKGSDRTEDITVQWVPAWSLDSAGV